MAEKLTFDAVVMRHGDRFLQGKYKELSAIINGETINIGDTLYIITDNEELIKGELTEFVLDEWSDNYYDVEELSLDGEHIALTDILWLGICRL